MKTLLVSVLFAFAGVSAIGACSSDNTAALVTTSDAGTVPQDGVCSQTSDCESPLQCGFPIVNDAGTCPSTGVCVSMQACTYQVVCPCGGTTYVNACVTPAYATAPISPMGTGCTGGSDSGAPTPPADSGTTAPTDSGGGGQTTGG